MPIEVTMPKLSPTMETGVIAQWLVKVGDQVKEGDALADIETDKATMPMKSYDDGTIVHIDHAAGDEVALGQRVLVLAKKGEDPKQVAESLGLGQARKPRPRPRPPEPRQPASRRDAARQRPARGLRATPPATASRRRPTAEQPGRAGSRPARWRGRWPRRRRSTWARCAARAPAAGSSAATSRRSCKQSRRHAARRRLPRPSRQGSTAAASSVPAAAVGTRSPPQRIPHTRMRKTIAQRMLEAKQTAPEIHLTVDVRVDRLVAAREELNKHLAAEGIKLSLGDFVTKAVALALRLHPGVERQLRARCDRPPRRDQYRHRRRPRRGPDRPGLASRRYPGPARDPRPERGAGRRGAGQHALTSEQLTGGTFTISNLGMYGTRQFDAILNLPEVGILAVGAAEKRPVVEGDRLAVGTVMTAHPDRRPPRRRRSHGRRVPPDLEGAAGRAGVHAAL